MNDDIELLSSSTTPTGFLRDSDCWLRFRGGLVGRGWCPPGAPLPSSNLVPFGRGWHARGRRHFRGKPGKAPQHAQVSTKHGEGGEQLDRRQASGVLNPCARESKARTGRFPREKLISDHDMFSSNQGGTANGQHFWGVFQGCTGLWTAGCWLEHRLRQLKASTAVDLSTVIFSSFA